MNERKPWTQEEDQLLLQIVNERGLHSGYKRMRWNDIAQRISKLTSKNVRTAKQCRERWFNHLHPDIDKQHAWTEQQKRILFQKQQELGNQWVKISKYLLGRSENSIKNYFYCCLRKALRKVNNFLHYNRRESKYKNIKTFKQALIGKFMTVLEKKTEKKIHVKSDEAYILARQIKNLLIDIEVFQKQEQTEKSSQMMEMTIMKIQSFNRACKRKKLKKKDCKQNINIESFTMKQQIEQSQHQEEEEQQNQQESQNQFYQDNLERMEQSEEVKQNSNQDLSKNKKMQCFKQTVQKASLKQQKIEVSQNLLKNVRNESSNFVCSQQSKTETVKMSAETSYNFDFSKMIIHPTSRPLLPIIPVAQPIFYHGSAFMPTLLSPSLIFNYQRQKEQQPHDQPSISNIWSKDVKETFPQKPSTKQSINCNNIKPSKE